MIKLNVNNKEYNIDVKPDERLLWVLRDHLDLKGAKFGCGIAQCGACKVHVDGKALPSCIIPVGTVIGSKITTIEGLASSNGKLHPVQKAWMEENVPQCGYCQPGQIMTAAAFLEDNPNPTDEEIDGVMSGNICRCGTYDRVKKAIGLLKK
tara:strand:+ start:2418 stop:2870 length:453 start_codon:yes stop_codon:yes gene_type:complete